MEKVLGRPLRKGESPHHKNGVRDDNRADNLELWVTPPRYGQRVTDLVQWIVDQYPEAAAKALKP
ncbi:MAG: HNH endonuclease [Trebonia sp.]